MRITLLLLAIVISGIVFAGTSFVLTIDGSGSMTAKINGTVKFEIARTAALCMLDSFNTSDEMAIYVFEDYSKITQLTPFTNDVSRLKSAVRGMDSSFGMTDLKRGINESATYALANASNQNKVILVVSDGGAASEALNKTTLAFHQMGISKIQVVGLNVKSNQPTGKALDDIATVGGGAFYSNLDYASMCDAMKQAYLDGKTGEGNGKCCPLSWLLRFPWLSWLRSSGRHRPEANIQPFRGMGERAH